MIKMAVSVINRVHNRNGVDLILDTIEIDKVIKVIFTHSTIQTVTVKVYHLSQCAQDDISTPVIFLPDKIKVFLLVAFDFRIVGCLRINELRIIRNVEGIRFYKFACNAGKIIILWCHAWGEFMVKSTWKLEDIIIILDDRLAAYNTAPVFIAVAAAVIFTLISRIDTVIYSSGACVRIVVCTEQGSKLFGIFCKIELLS